LFETAIRIPDTTNAIMADLDDFFAKKDKKKKGSKGFHKGNIDVLKDNIEESERKNEKKNMEESKAAQLATSEAARASMAGEDVAAVKEKEKAAAAADAAQGGGGAKGSAANDDDWLSHDEEKKDYSGLKIGALKIEDKDAEPEEEHEINEEGERVLVKKGGDVWAQKRNSSKENSRDSSPAPKVSQDARSAEQAPPSAAPASAAGEKPASTGGYVPPHLRGGGPPRDGPPRPCDGISSTTSYNAALAGGGRRHRGPRAAPNLNSEVNFPSLGGGAPGTEGAWSQSKQSDFAEVRGGQQLRSGGRAAEGPNLALGNKFAALRD